MIIWPATTHRSNWTTFPTPGWQCACSDAGYTDSYISLQWLQRIFDPETKERARGKPRVLICDGFGTHETLEVLEFCFANNIILCRLPSHTSHKLQPCDVAVFAPLKAAYREQAERLERGGVNTIGKEHFTSLYSPAREKGFTSKNIIAGFAASGLFPLNPDRVLKTMPKPLADLTIVKADEVNVGACDQSEVPPTPVTPVSEQGLVSLQKMIIEQDSSTLNDASKQRLQRRLHKLVKAAQLSFAKGALQQNHIRFLLTINNEAKVRRSTKSLVLGKAKVMGYEELVEAREKRVEKDAAQKAKGQGKRGRKRTSAVLEADKAEPNTKARRIARKLLSKLTTSTVAAVVGVESAPTPWRAPVARMY
ncbi:transposase [Curvularia clavata]|uniref:Transposase n=1 Tax=Curvularia clavata TaxID=95742 RepID=A0A9Q8Z286_CURCL|nr:transposase [Curvularia clavata]